MGNRVKGWLLGLTITLTFPISLPLLFILLATETYFLPSERHFWRRMKKLGRTTGIEVLGRGGTIIHDTTTLSWAVSRLWWTPDDVLDLAPSPPLTRAQWDELPENPDAMLESAAFDRWVSDRYLDPERGSALLLAVWHPRRKLQQIRVGHPGYKVVEACSGLVRHCRPRMKHGGDGVG